LLRSPAAGGSHGPAQVTIDTHTGVVTNGSSGPIGTVDRRFQQITPTSIPLSKSQLDAKTRLELIRVLQANRALPCAPCRADTRA